MMSLFIKAIIINSKDNVATASKTLKKNQKYDLHGNVIMVKGDINPGFKIALENIKKGNLVIKYGEIIGKAIKNIEEGELVHSHNLVGIRGRGDGISQKEIVK